MENTGVDKQALREQRLRARNVLERLGRAEFKPETSAKWVDITRSRDGSLRVQIEHDTIKGCTPAMIRWWFENLAATTMWNGDDFSGPQVSHYHLWHHRDHISVTPLADGQGPSPNRGFALGATSVIREQFNDVHDRISAQATVTCFDDSEFTFTVRQFGIPVARLTHRYHPIGDDLRFYTDTEIGLKTPVLGPLFNWLIRPWLYSKKTAEYWIKHNIEETGQTEAILPALYEARLKVAH